MQEVTMDDRNARAAAAKAGSPYLNTGQAAHFMGLSQRTLERMRTLGAGPKYRKHGRHVRYLIDDLEAWSAAQERHSTSEYAVLGGSPAHS
jgi:predicted DNA-binding transcriptional regulator AlpA